MAIFDIAFFEFSKGISAALGAKVGIFFDLPSLFIVFGGTFGASNKFQISRYKKNSFTVQAALTAPSEGEEAETINQIVELSQEARVNGLFL